MTAATHPLAELVLSRLDTGAAGFSISDGALVEIAGAYGTAIGSEDAGAATQALLQVAMFLDVEKKSPAASNPLVALVFAAEPLLRLRADADARKATEQVAATRERYKDFTGDARVSNVLDSGVRPEGTVAANPLARFQLKVPEKK